MYLELRSFNEMPLGVAMPGNKHKLPISGESDKSLLTRG